jgi:hypothetical protein
MILRRWSLSKENRGNNPLMDLKNLLYYATIGVSKYLIGVSKYLIGICITEIRFYICSLYTRPSAEYRSVYISHV